MKETGMIDRVPFLPQAVLVCFDTLNVCFKRIKFPLIIINLLQDDLCVQPPSTLAAAASSAAIPDMQFPLFVTLTRSGDLR